MSSITLKNLPEGLLGNLRDAAEQNHRSLNQHALFLLERSLSRAADEADSHGAVAAQLAAWRELSGQWRSAETTKQEVQRIYRRRSAGRKVEL
jgi:plasmid stability protein